MQWAEAEGQISAAISGALRLFREIVAQVAVKKHTITPQIFCGIIIV